MNHKTSIFSTNFIDKDQHISLQLHSLRSVQFKGRNKIPKIEMTCKLEFGTNDLEES